MTPQPMKPHGLAGRLFAPMMERLNQHAYRAAAAHIALVPQGRFLEIGFGTGALLARLAKTCPDVELCGVELSPLMRAQAEKRLRAHKRVDLRLDSGAVLSWPDDHFDAVAALHCFQFWPDPGTSLSEIARVLKPGGRLVVILRHHPPGRVPGWLPNPLSKGPAELDDLAGLCARLGLAECDRGSVGQSPLFVARK